MPRAFAAALQRRGAGRVSEKPIRFMVPSALGGSVDVLMRILTQQLSAQMGVAFVVENKPGASFVPGPWISSRPRRTATRWDTATSCRLRSITAAADASLRRGEGPHAGVELRARVQHARGEQRPAGAHGARSYRLREEESRQAPNGSSGNGTTGHLGGELFKA